MAKTKQDWLKEAKALGLNLTPKEKIADIKAAIEAETSKSKPAQQQTQRTEPTAETPAKAGKRSRKSQEEAEAKAVKETLKRGQDEQAEATAAAKRGPTPKTRPLIERRGKKYQTAAKNIDTAKEYSLTDAAKLAASTSPVKFDASVELHVNLNVDPKQSDQNIRETVVLPHGTGKTLRVAVFAPREEQDKAKAVGADFAGEEELINKLSQEDIDFDVLIAMPQLMSQLGRFARLLGPRGLMPNPKSGTVTNNVAQAVKQAKGGRVEFRIDKEGIIHLAIGKVSFGPEKIEANARTVLDAVKTAKPASVKSQYLRSIHLSTTMGPSVRIEPTALSSG